MSLKDSCDEEHDTVRLRALAHPVRLRVLSLLTGGAAMTATEVARELDLTHANASYHLRQLLSAGLLEVAGEENIRGGLARRYRYDIERDLHRAHSTSGDASPGERQLLLAALAEELRRRGGRVRSEPSNHLTDAELSVSPDVWYEICDQIASASARLHRAAQPPRSPGTIRVSATVALFRLAD